MRLTECEGEVLRWLAAMPFLDRLDLVAISGWSRGSVYHAVGRLAALGALSWVPHAARLIPPARRYCLTADGLHHLSMVDGVTVEELLVRYPVSARWQRRLLGRLDALAVIYSLASAISNMSHPIRFRWYRALPMDASILLPDGRVVAVVRQGLTSDRTGFAKRIWNLKHGARPSAVLVLTTDEVRLRYARRVLAGSPSIAFVALEKDAVDDGADTRVWHMPSGQTVLDLRTALSHASRGGASATEKPAARASLPEGLALDGSERTAPDHLLPALLKPVEKRTLDLLGDWPWITFPHLGGLMGLERSRLSALLQRLRRFGLVTAPVVQGCARHVLTDRALALLARRDRTSVGVARQRWSVGSWDLGRPFDWRKVPGARSRQLVRHIEHTESVHWFLALLSRQARSLGWEVVQLDPPQRASRYFRHEDRLRAVRPDAFGALRKEGRAWSFFLEWERRAVRPVTMAARLAPYLRYFSTHQPTDDNGGQPVVLVVFEDDLAHSHFLRVADEQVTRSTVQAPVLVSHRDLVEKEGPPGQGLDRP